MSYDAITVIAIILVAVILFAWDKIPSDFVAICLMVGFVVTGILTPNESLSGFSNPATLTVAFMFVLSHALLQTGFLQHYSPVIGDFFRRNFNLGLVSLILFVGVASAFINNTPIVAMFIPVVVSIAYRTGVSTSKLLIPLSYASILGGTCTLLGTSTNVLVSGIAEEYGVASFNMFTSTPIGLVFLITGSLFLFFLGKRLLPDHRLRGSLRSYEREYMTEIKVLAGSKLIGSSIMSSILYEELQVDVVEVKRQEGSFYMPQGDFIFRLNDVIRLRANLTKIKALKDRLNYEISQSQLVLNQEDPATGNTTILEIIISKGSAFEGKTLKQVDFRRRYRAIPLAILHQEDFLGESLYDQELGAGDMLLIEIKSHRLDTLKREEMQRNSPFTILNEEGIIDFDRKKFGWVMGVLSFIVLSSAFNLLPIVTSVSAGIAFLVVVRVIRMKEIYQSIDWRIVFLLAGAISIGVAMERSGLASAISLFLVDEVLPLGPIFLVAGLYLITSICTELMSNTATAALFAPIAIGIAQQGHISPTPLLITVMLAASASFMTPIGYQTNAMVFSAGRYKFKDFLRIGIWLNLILWVLATLLIPVFYPF